MVSNISRKARRKAENKYRQCIFCHKIITNDYLNEHIRRHIQEKPYNCKVCEKSFCVKAEIYMHLKAPSSSCFLKAHECEYCLADFRYEPDLWKHLETVNHGNKYMCRFCSKPKYFDNRTSLDTHLAELHSGKSPFRCDICDRNLTTKTHLTKHLLTHEENKCRFCSGVFSSKSKLNYHIMSHTGGKYKCKICGWKFKNTTHLQNHSSTHTGKKAFSCATCDRKVSRKSNLKEHVKSFHDSEKPHSCHFCGKSYGLKSTLDQHIRTHTKTGYLTCEICTKSFHDNSKLKAHKMRHAGEKNLKCPKRFVVKIEVNWHVMCVHTRERPYPCTFASCPGSFRNMSHLRVHISTVHKKEKRFHCIFCQQLFMHRSTFESHLRKHISMNHRFYVQNAIRVTLQRFR